MFACGSHHFLSALIIPHFAFAINLALRLFTFYSFFLLPLTEKEPLPQLVEVLLHATARAATFLVFGSHVYCDSSQIALTSFSFCFNLMQSHGLRPKVRAQVSPERTISILCSHADCDALPIFGSPAEHIFQSYAVMRTATDDSDNICVSILCSRVDYIVPKESKTSDAHSFNLMQPTLAASQRAKKKVEVQQSFNLIQPTLAALTLTIVSNAGTLF